MVLFYEFNNILFTFFAITPRALSFFANKTPIFHINKKEDTEYYETKYKTIDMINH